MPIKVEQLPGESIIIATVSELSDSQQDVPAMFADITQLRLKIRGTVVLILDFSDAKVSFNQIAVGLGEAFKGIKAGKADGIERPPIVILVGSGVTTKVTSKVMTQMPEFANGHMCTSKDEALVLARKLLSTQEE
ncbi:MAG: hypothetical protein JXB07_01410 [Anaerolineae bacterium]|nr:hypothetical protein [Anaerolineae bacterium]